MTATMTPKQFEERMLALARDPNPDLEVTHHRADDLLCEVLVELGYAKGVLVFQKMDKWYA